ncbi:hypothetical protein GCM10027043_00620 [Ferruginibacter profundus]
MAVTIFYSSCKKNEPAITSTDSATGNKATAVAFFPKDALPTDIHFQNGKTLSLLQKDSTYYLDGDIILSLAQLEIIKANNSGQQRTFTSDVARNWELGRVAYVINAGFSAADRNTILDAIADWRAVSSLDIVPRQSDGNYIEFMPSTVNNSYVGRQNGRQVINLATTVNRSSAIHEIGHAIGFFHEQSRADRDNEIVVNWANIRPAMQFNFLTYAQQGIPGADLGTFDFNSIMLYPSFIFDPNFVFDPFTPVMTRLNGTTWGTSTVLSAGDIESAAFLYGPPFASVDLVPTYSYHNPNGEDFDEYGDVVINFWADASHTTPAILSVTKTANIRHSLSSYHGSGTNNYSYSETSYTLTAGQSSYTITQYHNYDDSYLGISNNYEYNDFYLRNGYRR